MEVKLSIKVQIVYIFTAMLALLSAIIVTMGLESAAHPHRLNNSSRT
jgi:hypothetical protein